MPKLNGLVLAGGKSVRMGTAKERINWHGKEQQFFAADLLRNFCDEVFISCRHDQNEVQNPDYQFLSDTFLNLGPLGGILTALRSDREKAWLVVACDLPVLDQNTLQHLSDSRDSEKIATTFKSPFDGLPEPLITIWEPKSYPLLLEFLGREITCPRKVLINSNTLILEPQNPESLMNVNTPDEAKIAENILLNQKK
ncbi:NTP transferase domain-containing protein [Chryseobacterium sp. Leaf180]|uniref:NTP transferase domain-containing protein n=1 Tax=Chryseobacterium sp. Leaf180 TaxID=1736289 RepID=UPI000A55B84A|nr:NTP transferase domain-containing protein [Chryseobacterium sp. Leaf180]